MPQRLYKCRRNLALQQPHIVHNTRHNPPGLLPIKKRHLQLLHLLVQCQANAENNPLPHIGDAIRIKPVERGKKRSHDQIENKNPSQPFQFFRARLGQRYTAFFAQPRNRRLWIALWASLLLNQRLHVGF